jgi:hypothetical protein
LWISGFEGSLKGQIIIHPHENPCPLSPMNPFSCFVVPRPIKWPWRIKTLFDTLKQKTYYSPLKKTLEPPRSAPAGMPVQQ